MSEKEQRVWQYLLANRGHTYSKVAQACDVEEEFVKRMIDRIGSENWREEIPTEQKWDRAKVLDTAKGYVTKDRAADHGDMEDNFRTIASYWNTHLGLIEGFIEPQDVAVMMTLLKIARIRQNEKHLDNWIDGCGYMACGGEIVSK